MSKNNNWLAFMLGAAAGAGLTWLLTSEEGKKAMNKLQEEAGDLLDEILGGEIDSPNEDINETKTQTNGK
ncbi:MAG: YtxH domain-containing protein [bacterium]|nr:YtxH domain-containing protein [bacterium]